MKNNINIKKSQEEGHMSMLDSNWVKGKIQVEVFGDRGHFNLKRKCKITCDYYDKESHFNRDCLKQNKEVVKENQNMRVC